MSSRGLLRSSYPKESTDMYFTNTMVSQVLVTDILMQFNSNNNIL